MKGHAENSRLEWDKERFEMIKHVVEKKPPCRRVRWHQVGGEVVWNQCRPGQCRPSWTTTAPLYRSLLDTGLNVIGEEWLPLIFENNDSARTLDIYRIIDINVQNEENPQNKIVRKDQNLQRCLRIRRLRRPEWATKVDKDKSALP